MGYTGGARAVHEQLAMPKGIAERFVHARELWEWQAARHGLANDTYLLAFSSQDHPSSPKFDSNSVQGAQCMAAFQIAPAESGGVQVQMSTHPNPNLAGIITGWSWLWKSASENMLADYVVDLRKEAQRRADLRQQGKLMGQGLVDGGVLALLSPAPPGQKFNVSFSPGTLVRILEQRNFIEQFAKLDLTQALNTTWWTLDSFSRHAENVFQLGLRLKPNATKQEISAFATRAKDELEMQMQGESLSAIQWRIK